MKTDGSLAHAMRAERGADTGFVVMVYTDEEEEGARATAEYSGQLQHMPHACLALMHLVTSNMPDDAERDTFISRIAEQMRINLLGRDEPCEDEEGENRLKCYRHKPTIVQAIQYDGTAEMREKICELFPGDLSIGLARDNDPDLADDALFCITMDEAIEVSSGDWVIKGVDGKPYPCPASVFEGSYELAE